MRLISAASAVLVFYGIPRASSRPVSSLDPQHNFQQHKARIFPGCRDGEADESGLQSAFGRGSTVSFEIVDGWTSLACRTRPRLSQAKWRFSSAQAASRCSPNLVCADLQIFWQTWLERCRDSDPHEFRRYWIAHLTKLLPCLKIRKMGIAQTHAWHHFAKQSELRTASEADSSSLPIIIWQLRIGCRQRQGQGGPQICLSTPKWVT